MSEKMRRIKIISNKDGSYILDAETGNQLDFVTNVVVRFDERNRFVPIAEVTFFNPDIEIEADVEIETRKSIRRLEHTA